MNDAAPTPVPHEAISASAGSGKTFQLAHRYLRLLALGVAPDRIVALTFSRKAAGEIFESVLGLLCRAAADPQAAAQTAARVEQPLTQADFTRLLRRFLERLHRIHIGTLDSFIVGVARAFPTELGIAPNFQILDADSPAAAELRREALAALFDPRRAGAREQREFLEAFKLATFGRQEKSLADLLDRFLAEERERFLTLPEAAAWSPERVWPRGSPWDQPPAAVEQPLRDLWSALEAAALPERQRERWRAFAEGVAAFTPGAALPRQLEYLLPKLSAALDDLRRGSAILTLDRKPCRLGPDACRAVLAVLHYLIGGELQACAAKTRGLFAILQRYEALYERLWRLSGRLTFSDAQYLLTAANRHSGGALLSREPNGAGRLYIDYRLDSRLDHWLIDEFQDTSDLQWAALRNLVDEIVQDDSGRRSFFYVGDIKQAIYGWRGGNARLFGRLLAAYPGAIRQRALARSFRSAPAVIETVNRVFGRLPEDALPAAAVRRWAELWQEHACGAGVPAEGYAALLEPPCDGTGPKPGAEDRYRLAIRLLQHLDPARRGLSVAVLVRRNKTGRELVDRLRCECPGLPVVHEGRAPILDNPVVAALLALIKLAAHPGDTFAWRHVQMSPLGEALAAAGLRREDAAPALLRRWQSDGAAGFVRHWGEALHRVAPLDAFGRRRLEDLAAAALAFDAQPQREPDAFLRFVAGYQTAAAAAGHAVRVMTVHQSKGLGFDAVILPELMDGSLARSDADGLRIRKHPQTDEPQWAFYMPRRLFTAADPVLAEELQRADEDACFDALCVLYVALTRAKRALYMVTSFPGRGAEAFTAAALLKRQLCGDEQAREGAAVLLAGERFTRLWETGNPEWAAAVRPAAPAAAAAGPPPLAEDFARRPSQRLRLERVEPSREEAAVLRAASLFSAESGAVREFGTAIHELFAQVEWPETADPQAIARAWNARSRAAADVRRDAAEQFRRALAAAEVRAALARPAGDVELWRETPFEIVLDGCRWVSGTFDRVVIERGADGAARRATIFDYKSNRIETEAQIRQAGAAYRPQLVLYRRALSGLLRLEEARIALRLVFTRAARVLEL